MQNSPKSMSLISLLVFFVGLFSLSTLSYAKEVNLYDQPKDASKILGKIDATKGLVPIFTQPDGEWMKVGDPLNGNVGWIKTADINANGAPSSFTFSQQVVNDGKGVPRSYQIIRYGDANNNINEKMFQDYLKQYQNKNLPTTTTGPRNANEAFQQFTNDVNSFYMRQMQMMQQMQQGPMIMPVLVVPAQPQTPATAVPQKK